MRHELAIESTTLPEGAIISVARIRNETPKSEGKPHTEVEARNEKATIRMSVADVSPHVLCDYLKLTVREIDRQRKKLVANKKPPVDFDKPKDFAEFVSTMAANQMFILDTK